MIPTFAQGLRLSASSLEAAAGARRRVRKAPLTIDAAYDFIDSFKYGKIHLVPTQVRQEMTAFLELIAANPPHTVVELGTNRGGTLFLLTRVAAPDASIVSVDLGAGPLEREPRARGDPSSRRSREIGNPSSSYEATRMPRPRSSGSINRRTVGRPALHRRRSHLRRRQERLRDVLAPRAQGRADRLPRHRRWASRERRRGAALLARGQRRGIPGARRRPRAQGGYGIGVLTKA